MRHRRAGSVAVAAWLTIAAGCTTPPPAAKTAGGTTAPIPCEEPRPEICTMHYAPVCGALEGGGSKTYSNACVACSDRAVTEYSEGACATDGNGDAPQG